MGNTLQMTAERYELKQWLKAIALCALLMILMFGVAHATDSSGITELDDQGSKFQNGIKMFAKWGGILMIVIGGVMIGSGKAQGALANTIFGIVLAIGLIMGAWGWFSANFSQGFAF
mgnify:FL=1